MITEVTERALAHTGRKEVLLTGGVAANKRLQQMIRIIAAEHEAKFDNVPTQYAIDNGAMIAWTGVLAHKHGMAVPVGKSYVRLRWRLEEAEVPWAR
jgi:tRNA A37 threonylcarbamoyltransferase TsaD